MYYFHYQLFKIFFYKFLNNYWNFISKSVFGIPNSLYFYGEESAHSFFY
jgi:hypothetical protein